MNKAVTPDQAQRKARRTVGVYWLWVALSVPMIAAILRYAASPDAYWDELLHPTGEWAARLLIVALALTPLSLLVPESRLVRWLLRHRRAIGVASFCYALAHLAIYVVEMGTLDFMLAEIGALGIWTGWVAFLLMLFPAMISSDRAMRALRSAWKPVQRLAYPAALFTLIHWLFIHDGMISGLVTFAPLILLEALRIGMIVRRTFFQPTLKETY